jgi:Tol biopolymer transport system component
MIERLNDALEGRYRVERELGSGGMATVYLAEDLKHRRNVALKVLKPELAAVVGAERFLAEIETTANLTHPNILPLYDSGEADSFLFYVMPYVEDESLRQRLDRERQLPVDEAVRITVAVAEALDYAHRQGVIHRDIKPANILVQDGQPVVADFGIALAVGAAGGRLTETGLSVGTPYYMSPEQATGDQEVGPASDTYSLACVLYEMLTGDPPYVGSTAQAVLGQIIAGDAKPAGQLRSSVPAHVDAALRRALERLPADRFTSTREFARALSSPAFRYGEPRAGRGAEPWARLGPPLAVLLVVAAAVAVWALLRGPEPGPVARFKIAFDPDEDLWYTSLNNPPRVSIAPDGSRFVYVGLTSPRRGALWLRSIDQLEGQKLAWTEGAVAPVISPDGDRVAYLIELPGRGYAIRVVSLAGGTPIELVPSGAGGPATWGPDGSVYFIATDRSTLARVDGSGGAIDTVLTLDLGDRYDTYTHPFVTADGRALIVTAVPPEPATPEVHVVDLATGTSTGSAPGTAGRVTRTGRFVFVTADGVVMAQDFDAGRLAPTGSPVPIEFGLGVRAEGTVDLALSRTGTLLYTLEMTEARERWVWVDENGRTEPMDPEWTQDDEFEAVALSPDGTRLAVEMFRDGRWDIWVKSVGPGAPSRLTFRGAVNRRPVWSPDGARIAFISVSSDGQDAWVRRTDGAGAPTLLLDLEPPIEEVLWSHAGEWLLAVVSQPDMDIVAIPLGTDEDPQPLLDGLSQEYQPALSPDDRWLAYVSNETGRPEVFVVPFPNVHEGRWQISSGGGVEPRWSADGQRLYIRHEDGSGLDVADMSGGPIAPARRTVFDVPPEEYFEVNEENHLYVVSPDERIIMLEAGQGDVSGELVVVLNWLASLERRLGGDE